MVYRGIHPLQIFLLRPGFWNDGVESDFLDDPLELPEHTNQQHTEVGCERGVGAIDCPDSCQCGQVNVVHDLMVGRYRQAEDARRRTCGKGGY